MITQTNERDDGGNTVCRAVFSQQYGILDNHDVLGVLDRALEAADASDMLARRFTHDGDSMSLSLLAPDVFALPDSEYGVGLELSNSEVDGPFAIHGFVYGAQCANGMLYGVKEGALTVGAPHRTDRYGRGRARGQTGGR